MAVHNIETTGKDIIAEYGGNAKGKTCKFTKLALARSSLYCFPNSIAVLVTGPSDGGIGAELLTTLAAVEPAHFILAGRNEAKITPVMKKIQAINPNVKLTFVELDLLENTSVRAAAEKIKAAVQGIDVLINNAGVMARQQFGLSKDGVEIHFAANHLGHFLLTNLLVDNLAKVNGVVINVSSMAYTLAEVNTEDPNFNDGKDYAAWVAYGRSKTANVLFTYGLAARYGDKFSSFLLANSVVDPEFLGEGFKLSGSRTAKFAAEGKEIPPTVPVSMQQSVATALMAALDPSLKAKSPAFLKECNIIEPLPYATDKDEVLKLWAVSEKLVGEKFGH
ncbi:NAD(P)-binding protein [Lophium mytilinum]|uniref:NAD(P)-binding protein n=1 Tax=Lophium mytilinum TaxID=390894 RepID=A0A6A6QK59_9PEZI|nr:NAD(P)-binding protein [Lophium mytilinum]